MEMDSLLCLRRLRLAEANDRATNEVTKRAKFS